MCLMVPPSHLSRKQPSFLPWKGCHKSHNKLFTRLFSSGLSLALKVNPSSSRLPGNNQSPSMLSSGITFQSKSWLTKPPLAIGFIGFIQRDLISPLTPSECQILEGSGREENIKHEGKSLSFIYLQKLHFFALYFPLFTFPHSVKF